jgi:hypothetical protein
MLSSSPGDRMWVQTGNHGGTHRRQTPGSAAAPDVAPDLTTAKTVAKISVVSHAAGGKKSGAHRSTGLDYCSRRRAVSYLPVESAERWLLGGGVGVLHTGGLQEGFGARDADHGAEGPVAWMMGSLVHVLPVRIAAPPNQ